MEDAPRNTRTDAQAIAPTAPDLASVVAARSAITDLAGIARVGMVLADLLAGNRRFVAGAPAPRDHARERAALLRGQSPVATVLACSDSRVAIEDTFDVPLGTVFGVKTAGGSLDVATLGTIEMAVTMLRTPLVIVMGHESCGAVRLAFGAETPAGALGDLVAQVRDNIRGAATPEDAVEAHTRATARRLVERSTVIRDAFEAGDVAIVPVLYRLADGRVELL